MGELERYMIIYGYVLPLAVTVAWLAWRAWGDLNAGERLYSGYMWRWWPALLPGVGLWLTLSLIAIGMAEGSGWLERHWGPWREAGEIARRMLRRMFGEIKED